METMPGIQGLLFSGLVCATCGTGPGVPGYCAVFAVVCRLLCVGCVLHGVRYLLLLAGCCVPAIVCLLLCVGCVLRGVLDLMFGSCCTVLAVLDLVFRICSCLPAIGRLLFRV